MSVLSRVNQARLAKARCTPSAERGDQKCAEAAAVVVEILTRVSATAAIGERARAIESLLAIAVVHPAIRCRSGPSATTTGQDRSQRAQGPGREGRGAV